MPTNKTERLARLAWLQNRLKSLHETREAIHRKEAAAAENEAAELARDFEASGGLSDLFPQIYHDRIGRALTRKEQSLAAASRQSEKTAMADARANVAERAYRKAQREHERAAEERAVLEILHWQLKPEE